jgi:hypothetical protein
MQVTTPSQEVNMCVVEKDVWRYPVGDGFELREDDMPNPYEPVDGAPWGGWALPWDRGLDGDLPREVLADAESERVAWWMFNVGVLLWEAQSGHASPMDLEACMPEARWIHWALCWLMESQPPPPPPWYRFAQRRAWKRRQISALHLITAMTGLYWGLQVQAERSACEEAQFARQAQGQAQAQVVWQ